MARTDETLRIPILMYHSIAGEVSHRSAYHRTATPRSVFAEHLALLKREGYESIHLSGIADALRNGDSAHKLVVLTFDDGYADFLTDALPLLSAYGYSATMFLPTAYIGGSRRTFKGRECLSWTEVRKLQGAGIEFGSHTVTHPQLHDLPESAIREEIELSKKIIEEQLGGKVRCFAYPFAFPQTDRRFALKLRGLLRNAGYRQGVCTAIGLASTASDLFFLERIPMNGSDDSRLFEAKLSGSYNWMRWAQRLKQRVHHFGVIGNENGIEFTDAKT